MDSARPVVRTLKEVGRSGRLELVLGQRSGRTVIRHLYSEVPHKVTHLYHPEGSSLAQLILMHTTAGLFPGDRLEVHIKVESGARILLTSQASTKVHPGDGFAEVCFRATVEAAAELHVYNDPWIPFRGARLRHRVDLQIAPDARLGYWESFMAGRISSGEAWEFDEIDTETRLSRAAELVYLDRYRLRPSITRPDGPWVMGNASYIATGLFCEPDLGRASERDLAAGLDASSVGVDQPVKGLTVVRSVTQSGVEQREVQNRMLSEHFNRMGEPVPDLRKY